MGKFFALTVKRHVGLSNDRGFIQHLIDMGGWLSAEERKAFGHVKLAHKGVSKTGKKNLYGEQAHAQTKPVT